MIIYEMRRRHEEVGFAKQGNAKLEKRSRWKLGPFEGSKSYSNHKMKFDLT